MKLRFSKAFFVFVVGLVFSSPTWAYKAGEYKLGLGALPLNLYKTSDSAKGEIAAIGEIFYPVIGQGSFSIFGQTLLSPRLAYTFLPKRSDTGATDISVFLLSLPMTGSFGLSESTHWSFGIGLLRIEQKGKGGTVLLNNGTGTSTFAKPNYSSTSQQFTLEGGINWVLTPSMDIGFDLIVASAFTDRRAMNGLFSFTYKFATGLGGGI